MIGRLVLIRVALVLVVAALVVRGRGDPQWRAARQTLMLLCGVAIAALIVIIVNHVPFAGQLETMENTVLQHAIRAAHGAPVYPAPTPAYVPLAYNPGFYYLTAPFLWIFGETVPVLRGVAVLGLLGCAALVYLAVERHTRSRWWGVMAVGLFAMAYRAMDSALDNAHSDSWLLCTALLGTYLIDRGTTRRAAVLGVLACAASFWFKQHGALFAIGAVLYLTWRDGVRRSWPYWVVAALAGPVLYVVCARVPFGPYFHYFTYVVPSGWSEPRLGMATRLISFFGRTYLVLGLAAVLATVVALRQPRERLTVWQAQLPFALLTAVQGTLDAGSSENVFIPAGTWLIVVGTIAIAEQFAPSRRATQAAPADKMSSALTPNAFDWRPIALAAAFAPLLYNPWTEIVSPRAPEARADLLRYVESLHAPVYMPDIGEFPGPPVLWPGANWVALDDMSRGPHRSRAEQQAALALLGPVLHPPSRPAYILTNWPLERERPPVRFASDRYTLVDSLGDRFRALHGVPKYFGSSWPQLLYRYEPGLASRDP